MMAWLPRISGGHLFCVPTALACFRSFTPRNLSRDFGQISVSGFGDKAPGVFESEQSRPFGRGGTGVVRNNCCGMLLGVGLLGGGALQRRDGCGQCWMQVLGMCLYGTRSAGKALAMHSLTEERGFEGFEYGDVGIVDGKLKGESRTVYEGGKVEGKDCGATVTSCKSQSVVINCLGGEAISGSVLGGVGRGIVIELEGAPNVQTDRKRKGNVAEREVGETCEWGTGGFEQWTAELMEKGEGELKAALDDLEAKTHPGDVRIGMLCLRLAQALDSADEDPDEILHYGNRALSIFGIVEESVDTAMCLQVIGSAHYKMEEFEMSISQLERAAGILKKMEAVVGEWKLKPLKLSVQLQLARSKVAIGMDEEALVNYFESLAISEKLLTPGHPELGSSYQQVAEACLEAGKHEEAMKLCFKALKIFQKFSGPNSAEVVSVRTLLVSIYVEIEEYEKVLEEQKKIRSVLEAHGQSEEIVSLDLSTCQTLFELRRYEEAIPVIQNVVKESEGNSTSQGHALVYLARAYTGLMKGKNALKYCRKAFSFLNTEESVEAGESLVELSSVYEDLNEMDDAISLCRRALTMFEKMSAQEETIADAEGQLGMLLLSKGKTEEALLYMKKAVATFEQISGPESENLIVLYSHIGMANNRLEKFHEAVEMFEKARSISIHLLGPNDPYTIDIYQNLANTCPILGRYDEAIENQKSIVEAARSLGKKASCSLDEAEKGLDRLMEEARLFQMCKIVPGDKKHLLSRQKALLKSWHRNYYG